MSRTIRRIAPAAAAVAVWTAGACTQTVLEPLADSVYVLQLANGRELPAILVLSQFATVSLLSDTLVFRQGSRYDRIRWTRTQDRGSGDAIVQREESHGRVIAIDSEMTLIDDVCADSESLALCVAPDTARFAGGTLVLEGPVPPAGRKEFRIAR